MTNESQRMKNEEVWRDTPLPQLLVEDMILLSGADHDAIVHLRDQITGLGSVAKVDDLRALAGESLGNDLQDAAVRSIVNISADEVSLVLTRLEQWRVLASDRQILLSDEQMERLRNNLDAIIHDYPFLKLIQKANRLSRESGNELQSLLYLCDLRGVYDDERENVIGFIPIVTLQIGYSKQNGGHDFLELVLAPDELNWIADETAQAMKKMKALESRVNSTLDKRESN